MIAHVDCVPIPPAEGPRSDEEAGAEYVGRWQFTEADNAAVIAEVEQLQAELMRRPSQRGQSVTASLTGETPYRAAAGAFGRFDTAAQAYGTAAETLEAQLTTHGFNRDPGLMRHIRGLRAAAVQVAATATAARQALIANHARGDEYHSTGWDAGSSGFRHG